MPWRNRPFTRLEAAIGSVAMCVTTVVAVLTLQGDAAKTNAQDRYGYDVESYKGCITRQENTKISNIRADVQREFLQIAANGRHDAADAFKAEGNSQQYHINEDTALREEELKKRVQNTAYTYCTKPPVPDGVTEVELPDAPYNDKAVK